jgi:hypothetical protein
MGPIHLLAPNGAGNPGTYGHPAGERFRDSTEIWRPETYALRMAG